MSFVVDLVSEDSFYTNLLLGLHKLLSKHKFEFHIGFLKKMSF